MRAIVQVVPRDDVPDPTGDLIRDRLFDLGSSDIRQVRVGKIIVLEFDGGDLATVTDRVKKLCQELLVNELTEQYSLKVEE